MSWLDVKLGVRMLAKFPGLTLVGGFAIAFAIWVGAATFELMSQVVAPTLPFESGRRMVGIRIWDTEASRAEPQLVHDFVQWRQEVRSVEELGAFRTVARNLITGDGVGEPVEVAELSASAFRITDVRPHLGRALLAADEGPDAPPVAVLGYDVWRTRFGADSSIIGATVRLGRTSHEIVGVMPEGFAFPVTHNLWTPLRLGPAAPRPREGPSLQVFGRLAPGVSLDEARAEVSALGARMRADLPETHRHLHPQVLGYVEEIFGGLSGLEMIAALSLNIPVLLFLALVCANVALLMFARAATRENELAVRSALGASRARIISQLFVEALVLGSVATVVGLLAARFGLRWLMNLVETEFLDGPLPFWFHASLSPTTVLYACLLTLLMAVITGVFPGFKVTRGLATRLRQAGAGGGGLHFGGVWTAVIVAQIAVTVALPAFTFAAEAERRQATGVQLDFDESRYISARLEMDRDPPPGAPLDTTRAAFLERYQAAFVELEERLRADASVAAVTYAERLPRQYHPHRIIELDSGGAAPIRDEWPLGYRVSSVSVGPAYFATFDAPVTMGRDFHSGDFVDGAVPVIVNESFVRNVLGGHNPLGRRLRYVEKEEWDGPLAEAERGPWYEIVGVVPDLGLAPEGYDPKFAGFYHPAAPRSIYPRQVAVRVRGDAGVFVRTLRSIATATDPTLRLYYPMPFTELDRSEEKFVIFWLRLLVAATAIVLTLSLAGIYAVMAFTVSQRTREIGIRVALGASRRDVILAIFRRPLIQVSLGVLTGMVLLAGLMSAAEGSVLSVRKVPILVVYSLVMLAICLLASIVPTRRALAVEPTEALRAE